MTLADRLYNDLQQAVRGRDAVRVSTIRLARAAIHNTEIERGRGLSDEEIVEILGREVKRRREAIEAYTKGNRDDLVKKESLELAILTEYLPVSLSEDELRKLITGAISELNAKDLRDLGRVMAVIMPKVKGRAEGKTVDRLVRSLLPRSR
jgi:uncharacterized protein YqeY